MGGTILRALTEWKGSRLSTSVQLSLLSDCGGDVASCLPFPPPTLPNHNGQASQTGSQNKPSLLRFVRLGHSNEASNWYTGDGLPPGDTPGSVPSQELLRNRDVTLSKWIPTDLSSHRAGEMAQLNLGPIPLPTWWLATMCNSSSRRLTAPFWPPQESSTHVMHIHA